MAHNIKLTKLPKSEVEMKGAVDAPLLDAAYKKALKRFKDNLDLPGFRKGHVPEKKIIEHIGEAALLEEAADIVLNDEYPKIVASQKIDAIGRPKVTITKLSLGNPLEFTIVTAVMPEFKLADYKKISHEILNKNYESSKKEDTEPTAKEVEDVVLQIRKNKAHYDWHEKNKDKDHDHKDHPDFDKLENLPELNDEFAKTVGKFESVAEMIEKIKQNIIEEKKHRNLEKVRATIMDALVKEVEIELPDILVESEIEKSLAQLKDEIERIGAKYENYLKETKKTEDDIRAELREGAGKKAKIQLIFNKIAEVEKLEPNKEILDNEVKQILEHYPGASESNARIYVATQLLNREVLKLLEAE